MCRRLPASWFAVALSVMLLASCGGDSESAAVDAASPAPPDAGGGEAADPAELAAEVDEDQLLGTILALQDLGTRFTFSSGDEAAADYLVGRLESYGLTVERDPFDAGGVQAENVIARLPGVEEPDVVYVFSAHYDSISVDPMNVAPGADDNATGVAAVVEAARILSTHRFRYSLWFVLTAAEEQGSLGSAHMVGWLSSEGVDVRGVIAPDMIGYWPLGDGDAFDILGDPASTELVDRMAAWATTLGVAHKTWIQHNYCYGDDHTNFQEAGFPAITPMDCVEAHNIPASGESTPHYHMPTDRTDTLHMPFTTRVAGVIVATFADLGQPVP
jgi:hypothetical protein